MLDVFLSISLLSVSVFGVRSVTVSTGIPFASALLGCTYLLHFLPPEMYVHGPVSIVTAFEMMIAVDFIQFVAHTLEHRFHLKSHAQHHANIKPCASDAFKTGWTDALLGLMLPLFTSLWIVRPNKTTAALFGGAYALWLQFIHSNTPLALSFDSALLVTPRYHRIHHKHPRKNFAHIFVFWDRVWGSAQMMEETH